MHGAGVGLARTRRGALPAAAVRLPAAGRDEPDRADAGPPRRRPAALLAEDGRGRPRQPQARTGRAPGHGHAVRRGHGPDARADERVAGHRHPHRRGHGRGDAAPGPAGREGARDRRRRRSGARTPRGPARFRASADRESHARARGGAGRRVGRAVLLDRGGGRARRRRRRGGHELYGARRQARVAEGRRARELGRLAPDGTRARQGDARRRLALRRPPRVDAERGGRLPVRGRGGGHRARPHQGRARRAPRRRRTRAAPHRTS